MKAGWRGRPERGVRSLKRLIIWLALHAGRRFCRVLLVPTCAYFLATAPEARRASRDFLPRALGRRTGWKESLHHLHCFATTLLDRVYLLHGRHDEFDVRLRDGRPFEEAIAQGRGCLLLGSHLGSFEMLAVLGARDRGLRVNMVMHREEGEGLRDLIAATGVSAPYRIIPLGHPGSMLCVKECLDRGEVVGILADRVYGAEATQMLAFLGVPARFSRSPFRLARIAGAPVLAVYGLFLGGNRYEIAFEEMPEPDAAPYVALLEREAKRAPYNWFNFYDYWETRE